MVIPSSLIGCIVGGLIVRYLKLEFKGMIKFCIGVLTISLAALFVFVISCPNVDFAGVTVEYNNKYEFEISRDMIWICWFDYLHIKKTSKQKTTITNQCK